MDSRNRLAKQLSELSFWVSRYLERDEKAWPDGSNWYCQQLGIDLDTFFGQVVVDIGCGPVASLHSFNARLKIGVDVLARSYQPLGIHGHDMIYLAAPAEDLPFVDNFVDAILSVNALDHVDDFESAIDEIHRVLKDSGKIFLAFNLEHKPTLQEPNTLSKDRVITALHGKFDLDRTFLTRLEGSITDRNAPGGVFVVHARKIPGKISLHQATTNQLLQRMREGNVSLEELDMEYILEHGAPASVFAERAAANAFLEYNRRADGWEKRLYKDWWIAVRNNPRYLFNRGLAAICLRAARAMLHRKH